jgi:hypothetical protein
VINEITITEEYAKINDLIGTITFERGTGAKNRDLGLMNSMEGTYVWVHVAEACPQTLVQLYRGLFRIFSNHGKPGGRPDADGGQGKGAGGLTGAGPHVCAELQFRAALLHNPNITAFAHQDQRMEVASGKHLEEVADTTRLESTMSFRQIWASMSLQEKICHVQHEICQSRRETAFVSGWKPSPTQTTPLACCK